MTGMFSLIRTGVVSFESDIDAAALPAHLAERLSRATTGVTIQDNHIAFTGGMFRFVTNGSVLVPFGWGDLTVDGTSHKIHYSLSIRQLVLVVAAPLIVATIFILAQPVWRRMLPFVPLMWLWLVGANLVLGVERFKRFVVRSIATAPRLARQSIRR